MRFLRVLRLTVAVLPCLPVVHAKDVFGKNTAWTGSDTKIWELQGKRRREDAARKYQGPQQMSWQEQLELKKRYEEAQRAQARQMTFLKSLPEPEPVNVSAPAGPITPKEAADNVHRNALIGTFEDAYTAALYLVQMKDPRAIQWLEKCARQPETEKGQSAIWWLIRASSESGPLQNHERARRYLDQRVAAGDAKAMVVLARAHLEGALGLGADSAQAITLFKRATQATQDSENAYHAAWTLSWLYTGFNDIAADESVSIEWLRVAARVAGERMKSQARTELATRLLAKSPASSAEQTEALALLEQAAGDDPKGALLLASLLTENGATFNPPSPPDPVRARDLLRVHVTAGKILPELSDRFLELCTADGPAQDLAGAAVAFLDGAWSHNPHRAAYSSCRAADLFAEGYGSLKPDTARARQLYQRAMGMDTDYKGEATAGFARLLIRSGDAAELTQAVQLLQTIVNASRFTTGSSEARYELARLHLRGRGVARDVLRAMVLLEESCKKREDPDGFAAATLLGQLYAKGRVVTRDQRRASGYFTRPAYENYVPAQFQLGLVYYHWEHEPLEWHRKFEAFNRVDRAAQAGHSGARLLLARFYREGFGIKEPDPATALAIYQSGDLAGNVEASVELASFYLQDKGGYYDPAGAFAAVSKAATTGNVHGLNQLGMCHLRGWGTPKDAAQAVQCFEKAGAGGLWLGARNAAKLYATGPDGVAVDAGKARQLLEVVSVRATPREQCETGRLYLGNDFLPADLERANYWLTQAANAGEAEAMKLLSELQLAQSNPDDTAAREAAVARLQTAAEAGNRDAALSLVRTLFQNPRRSSADTKKLNARLSANELLNDAALEKEVDAIWKGARLIEDDLERRKDPEKMYQMALLLHNEPNTMGPPFGLTLFSQTLFHHAAAAGNPDALYRMAMVNVKKGRAALADPEYNNAGVGRFGMRFSDAELGEALQRLRKSAASGNEQAIAYLKGRDISLTGPANDPAGIAKLESAAPND